MASAWQTLEEAALTLGISSRTLHRRLARGEFETRLENGRREVLVVIPEPQFPEADTPVTELSDTAATFEYTSEESSEASDMSASPATELSDDIQTTMLALHEDRIRRTDLAIMAYQQSVNVTAADARRAHRNSRIAIGVAGGMVTCAFVVALWATHSVTRAKGDVDHLNQVVRQLSDTADTRAREIEKLRSESQEARVAAARVEGELSVVSSAKTQATADTVPAASPSTQPVSATTQPVSVMQRIFDRVTMR